MKNLVKRQLVQMLPQQERFERIYSFSHWEKHVKNSLKNSEIRWILTEKGLIGSDATIKIALSKIKCAEDMRKLVDKLDKLGE